MNLLKRKVCPASLGRAVEDVWATWPHGGVEHHSNYAAGLLQFIAMIDTFLVPEKTRVIAKGDGPTLDIGGAGNRVFLLTLDITAVVEQESLDVSIFGSADGVTWAAKPIDKFPQKFYRGDHPLLLDLSRAAETKFLRAHWEVNRWGRGETTPLFEFHVSIKEVPSDILREATAEARTMI